MFSHCFILLLSLFIILSIILLRLNHREVSAQSVQSAQIIPCKNNIRINFSWSPNSQIEPYIFQIPVAANETDTPCSLDLQGDMSQGNDNRPTFPYIKIMSADYSKDRNTPIQLGSVLIQNLRCNNSFYSQRGIDGGCIVFASPISYVKDFITINNVDLENLQTPVISNETNPFSLPKTLRPSIVQHQGGISGMSSATYTMSNCSITTSSPTNFAPAPSFTGNYYQSHSANIFIFKFDQSNITDVNQFIFSQNSIVFQDNFWMVGNSTTEAMNLHLFHVDGYMKNISLIKISECFIQNQGIRLKAETVQLDLKLFVIGSIADGSLINIGSFIVQDVSLLLLRPATNLNIFPSGYSSTNMEAQKMTIVAFNFRGAIKNCSILSFTSVYFSSISPNPIVSLTYTRPYSDSSIDANGATPSQNRVRFGLLYFQEGIFNITSKFVTNQLRIEGLGFYRGIGHVDMFLLYVDGSSSSSISSSMTSVKKFEMTQSFLRAIGIYNVGFPDYASTPTWETNPTFLYGSSSDYSTGMAVAIFDGPVDDVGSLNFSDSQLDHVGFSNINYGNARIAHTIFATMISNIGSLEFRNCTISLAETSHYPRVPDIGLNIHLQFYIFALLPSSSAKTSSFIPGISAMIINVRDKISFTQIELAVSDQLLNITGTITIKLFEFYQATIQNFRSFEISDAMISFPASISNEFVSQRATATSSAISPPYSLRIQIVSDFWIMKDFDSVSVDGAKIHFSNPGPQINWFGGLFGFPAPFNEKMEYPFITADGAISINIFTSSCREYLNANPPANQKCGMIQKNSGFDKTKMVSISKMNSDLFSTSPTISTSLISSFSMQNCEISTLYPQMKISSLQSAIFVSILHLPGGFSNFPSILVTATNDNQNINNDEPFATIIFKNLAITGLYESNGDFLKASILTISSLTNIFAPNIYDPSIINSRTFSVSDHETSKAQNPPTSDDTTPQYMSKLLYISPSSSSSSQQQYQLLVPQAFFCKNLTMTDVVFRGKVFSLATIANDYKVWCTIITFNSQLSTVEGILIQSTKIVGRYDPRSSSAPGFVFPFRLDRLHDSNSDDYSLVVATLEIATNFGFFKVASLILIDVHNSGDFACATSIYDNGNLFEGNVYFFLIHFWYSVQEVADIAMVDCSLHCGRRIQTANRINVRALEIAENVIDVNRVFHQGIILNFSKAHVEGEAATHSDIEIGIGLLDKPIFRKFDDNNNNVYTQILATSTPIKLYFLGFTNFTVRDSVVETSAIKCRSRTKITMYEFSPKVMSDPNFGHLSRIDTYTFDNVSIKGEVNETVNPGGQGNCQLALIRSVPARRVSSTFCSTHCTFVQFAYVIHSSMARELFVFFGNFTIIRCVYAQITFQEIEDYVVENATRNSQVPVQNVVIAKNFMFLQGLRASVVYLGYTTLAAANSPASVPMHKPLGGKNGIQISILYNSIITKIEVFNPPDFFKFYLLSNFGVQQMRSAILALAALEIGTIHFQGGHFIADRFCVSCANSQIDNVVLGDSSVVSDLIQYEQSLEIRDNGRRGFKVLSSSTSSTSTLSSICPQWNETRMKQHQIELDLPKTFESQKLSDDAKGIGISVQNYLGVCGVQTKTEELTPTDEFIKNRTLTVPKLPIISKIEKSSVQKAQESLSGVGKTVAAFAGAPPPTAQTASKIMALAYLRQCGGDNGDSASIASNPLNWDSNPLMIQIKNDELSTYRGAVVGNLIVMLIVVGIAAIVVLVKVHFIKNKDEKKIGKKSAKYVKNPSYGEVLTKIHFPSILWPAIVAVGPPSALATASLIGYNSPFNFVGNVLISFPAMILFIVIPVLWCAWIMKKSGDPKHGKLIDVRQPSSVEVSKNKNNKSEISRKKNKNNNNSKQNLDEKFLESSSSSLSNEKDSSSSSILSKYWTYLTFPWKEWKPTKFVEQHGLVFDCYSVTYFALIDYFIVVSMSVIAGASLTCGKQLCCTVNGILVLILALAHTVTLCFVRPFLNRLDTVLGFAMSIGTLLASIATVLEIFGVTQISALTDSLEILTMVFAVVGAVAGFAPILSSVLKSVLKRFIRGSGRSSSTSKKKNISRDVENDNDDDEEELIVTQLKRQKRNNSSVHHRGQYFDDNNNQRRQNRNNANKFRNYEKEQEEDERNNSLINLRRSTSRSSEKIPSSSSSSSKRENKNDNSLSSTTTRNSSRSSSKSSQNNNNHDNNDRNRQRTSRRDENSSNKKSETKRERRFEDV